MISPWYTAIILVLIVLVFFLRHTPVMFFLAVFPATLAHEFAHLSAALLLNGGPVGFSVIPQRTENGYVLGSVQCANVRWYNGLFIGFAPITLFAAGAKLLSWISATVLTSIWLEGLLLYGIACLFYGSIPSWQDVKVALVSSWMAICFVFAAIWVVVEFAL